VLLELGAWLAIAASVGFSMKAIFVKLAYLYRVDAVAVLGLRMLFSLPFLLGAAFWANRRSIYRMTRRDWHAVLALGFMGYYLSSLFDFIGLQYISAGLERLILFLYPTVVVLIGVFWSRQRIDGRTIFALLLSYGGIALAFAHDLDGDRPLFQVVIGGSFIFACTITYAIYIAGSAPMVQRLGAVRFAALATTVASIACLLHAALTRPLVDFSLPWQVYFYTAAMALFSTVLPIFLTSKAIQLIGAARVSTMGAIGPVATIFLAWLFLGESVSLWQAAGAALVLSGVMLVALRKKPPSSRLEYDDEA